MAGASFFFIQKNLSRPVESLMEGMRRMGDGKLDNKLPILSDDEVGRLTAGFNGMLEDLRDREFVKATFGKYVPQQVAKAIRENKGEAKPENRLATILYSDIQGFTTVCEGLSPEGLVALLNEYFSLIVGIIDSHGGVVNQFQGDALLVTFNVPVENPDHARDAIRTALEIEHALDGHQFPGDIELVTRIGINTGRAVAGAVDAVESLNYTDHGNAVNIAARLESLNKEYGTRLLVSEETKQAAGEDFDYEAKGDQPIQGKSESVTVYAFAV
jgi:adenylate cyclase